MIYKLAFRNFYSFLNDVELDFVVNEHAPQTDAYMTDGFGNRLTKLLAVIGPNASGKTNLLRSICFISWFMTESFSMLKPDEDILFKPFLFKSSNKPSWLSIEFGVNDKIYRYELELELKRVLTESLSVKEDKRFKSVFARNFDPSTNEYVFNSYMLDVPSDFSKLIRANASTISAAHQINNELSKEIVDYFHSIVYNMSEQGKLSTETFAEALNYYNNHPEIKDEAERVLKNFDFSFSRIAIDKIDKEEGKISYFPKVYHRYIDSDSEGFLPLQYESAGTQNLFFLLRDILVALKEGGVVILDDMDSELHPLVIPEIVNLFTSKTVNPKNAQLIFSTHNVFILNNLDKQQIVLVEKKENGTSEAWHLSDLKTVRSDENFYSKYMSGAYGAIPKL